MSDDCTIERADCNETERMDKKNWSKLTKVYNGRRKLALLNLREITWKLGE